MVSEAGLNPENEEVTEVIACKVPLYRSAAHHENETDALTLNRFWTELLISCSKKSPDLITIAPKDLPKKWQVICWMVKERNCRG